MHTVSLLLLSTISVSAVPDNIVLEFTADSCIHCRQMSPIVSVLQRKGYPIRTVDADREPQLLQRFGVNLLPTFILVVDGKEADRIVGGMSENELRRFAMRVPKRSPSGRANVNSKTTGSKNQQPPKPKRSLAGSIVAKTKQALTPRIKLPLFGRAKDRRVAKDDPSAIVRAQLGEEETPRSTDPLECTARLKVQDGNGVSFGSGTIVDSQPGRTLILTCGHIFREMKNRSSVEVDIFHAAGKRTYQGEVVRFDMKSDIGLVAIATETELAVSKVATSDRELRKGNPVFSVGCSNGDNPTKLQRRVTTLNRYLGPDNIECTGVPVQGRSGGGLFNAHGEIIGICVAADPKDGRGLYAGLKPIHGFLANCGLSHLLPATSTNSRDSRSFDREDSVAVSHVRDGLEISPHPPGARKIGLATQQKNAKRFPIATKDLTPATLAAMNHAGEAEVVCIIRPLDGSRDTSRVVIINRASKRFVASLQREMQSQTQPTTLSLRTDNDARESNHAVHNNDLINRKVLDAKRASRRNLASAKFIAPAPADVARTPQVQRHHVERRQSEPPARRFRRK